MKYRLIDPAYILDASLWAELGKQAKQNDSDLKTEIANLFYKLLDRDDQKGISIESIKKNIFIGLDDGDHEVYQNDHYISLVTVDSGMIVPLPEPIYKRIAPLFMLNNPFAATAIVTQDTPVKFKYIG